MSVKTQQVQFDVETQQIAKVYAKAFFGAAQNAGQTDALIAELQSLLDDVLEKNPELFRILSSNFVNNEDKEGILDRVFGKQALPMLMAFLKVLSKHGRFDCLPAVRVEVEHMHQDLLGQVEVIVQTAVEASDAAIQKLAEALRRLLGKEPIMIMQVLPQLLGGVVVRAGDRVYDGSVATQLSHLRTKLINRTVEEIETQRERFLSESGSASA